MILHAKQSEKAGVRVAIHPPTLYSSGTWDKGKGRLLSSDFEICSLICVIDVNLHCCDNPNNLITID